MSHHPTSFVGDPRVAIKEAVEKAIPESTCHAEGGGGHFNITVTAAGFAGQSLLAKQRQVLQAIAHLMKGENAPVHAVDTLVTNTP